MERYYNAEAAAAAAGGEDKLAVGRVIWELWTAWLSLMFSPAVDKQLMPHQGRCGFQSRPENCAKALLDELDSVSEGHVTDESIIF
ncbi:hypothetical protein GBF38_015579 [Nibea albiflora]|uniref:Uncharacterized protein n=1 Tax=Nibea albiflora TaxID=240163 RepID=A0ACB7EMB4_NIBAL|nr:hypothetical protein GBF38_015579 [Nibea albiflora]